ncbi:hypothetical protein U9M48_038260 [Paspalum notatum var. saurae]|uniref:Methyltransferase-like protein 13 n=1 Tax=Paspalum notatum var. saurae TaxID=547442 RepID=A0AAQ3UGP4_PASNO
MAVSPELEGLRRIVPSRFVSFSFPNPFLGGAPNPYGDSYAGECIRVAVLDSPLPAPSVPSTVAMLVPAGRHRDWIFSTRAGHLHLLLSSTHVSRFIILGPELSAPSPRVVSCVSRPEPDPAHARLLPLLLALCPAAAFLGNARHAVPDVPLLTFHDDLLRLAPVKVVAGPVVGEMVVEDVAIDCAPGPVELRRRLRFKRMPCLVQTQVRLCPSSAAAAAASSSLLEALDGSGGLLQPEVGGSLVEPYLQAMVAGLAVIAPSVDESIQSGVRPTCLCAGVGGGSLPMSIRVGLQFNVLGVEADSVVLDVARNHFGLVEDEFLRVHVGDAIQTIEEFSRQGEADMNFSAVMVDLDSSDAMCGVSAPPLEMTHANILLSAHTILHHHGVLILNVMPPPADVSFYQGLVDVLRQVFSELYEIDVGNGENYVLIATVSPIETRVTDNSGQFLTELRKLAGDFLEHIRKI